MGCWWGEWGEWVVGLHCASAGCTLGASFSTAVTWQGSAVHVLHARPATSAGSRKTSNACRVKLDLKDCPEFAVYPGQLVAACGVSFPRVAVSSQTGS